jgi:branched-chain amino acid transport system permease protein
VCVLAGAATYVGLVQPYLSRGSTIGWVAGTAAVAFAIRALIGAVFQRSSYVFPDPLPFHRVGTAGFVHIGGAQVQARAFFVAGLAIALALGSAWFLERTRHGRALRAVADDREGARVVGVPVELLITLAFALVGALAMVAAIAAAPGEAVNANTGTLLGLKGLVAALAVRFGPPLKAFAAGLVLGVVESAIANIHLGGWQLGPSYREVLPLLAVLLLISLWPSREALEERE